MGTPCMNPIPVSVVIVTKDETIRIKDCLMQLQNHYDDVFVVDSGNDPIMDQLCDAVHLIRYQWNGQYPKKRQYCLDHLSFKYDYVFFLDVDEIIHDDFHAALRQIFNTEPIHDAYMIHSYYIWQGKRLKHGMGNHKIALFNRHKMLFPVVNDLHFEGMGEIEGHYQPVWQDGISGSIGKFPISMIHDAAAEAIHWFARHERYARWEAAMIRHDAYPIDPIAWRQLLKKLYRRLPCRGLIAFIHSFIWKKGFLDGRAGWSFAKARAWYYGRVRYYFILKPKD
jgi:glycosyltransferase involved in cell wall biosynthesis